MYKAVLAIDPSDAVTLYNYGVCVCVCVCVYTVPPPLLPQLELSYASLRTRETQSS